MKITFFGHATFKLESPKGKKIIIDPWISNPVAPSNVDKGPYDYILITHGHGDHLGDILEIAKNSPSGKILCIHEIQQFLFKQGIKNAIGMNIGGSYEEEGLKFIMVPALHSSSFMDGSYAGEPAGFVIIFEDGTTVYHAGDTGLFGDMKLIKELYAPKIVLLPIGDHYVMGPKEAAKACELLSPEVVIPMHYQTFPLLRGTPEEFEKELKNLGISPKVVPLKPGETFQI